MFLYDCFISDELLSLSQTDRSSFCAILDVMSRIISLLLNDQIEYLCKLLLVVKYTHSISISVLIFIGKVFILEVWLMLLSKETSKNFITIITNRHYGHYS